MPPWRKRAAPPAPATARPGVATDAATAPPDADEVVFRTSHLDVYYGSARALRDVSIDIPANRITAIIGPSGCGKLTFLRCLNRMNDLIPGARHEGEILFRGQDLYAPNIDAVDVRRRIGMVFQAPNPFPKSIRENLLFGMRVNGIEADDERIEAVLRRAALWDEVKDKLGQDALALSGGQQQRLCIARAIAVEPDVILMDEPCSALDPISTRAIEDLMNELATRYTIVIVTHNMQQAARVAHLTAFFTVDGTDQGESYGVLAEYGETEQVFAAPVDPRTRDYVTGRFG